VVTWTDYENIKGWKEKRKAKPSTWNWEWGRCLDTEFFASAASEQARAESCDQNGRKSTKLIGNRPSRVVKSSTSRWSRSTKQPSRSFHQTRMTTGSICHRHSNTTSCIAEQDQRSAVAIFLTSMSVRVRRPKLFKNLCQSIVSGVSPLLFQDYTPVPHSAPCYATELGLALELVTV